MLAVAMVGLICIGLLGLGGAVFFIFNNKAQQAAAVTPTFTPILPTFTPTAIPSPTPTEKPPPTPTSTPVVQPAGAEPAATEVLVLETTPNPEVTPTNTLVVQPPTSTPSVTPSPSPAVAEAMPGSGGVLSARNGVLVWAGVGMLVLLIAGMFNYSRSIRLK